MSLKLKTNIRIFRLVSVIFIGSVKELNDILFIYFIAIIISRF